MDRRAVAVVHLVEFVDAADAVVGQHQRAALEDHLVRDGVAHDGGGETDSRGSTAGGVDSSGGHFADVLEQLRFGHTGISHEADVDVTSDSHTITHLLRGSTNEKEEETLLDVFMAVDFRRDRPREGIVEIAGCAELLDAADSAWVDDDVIVLLLVLLDVHGLEVGISQQTSFDGLEAGVGRREKDAGDIDNFTGVNRAGSGAVGVDSEGTGDVADRNLVRHLLDTDFLEWEKFGGTRRHEKLASGIIALAFIRGTVDERGEGLGLDLLEDLGSAAVARVGVDQDGGFHVRDTCRDATNGDEVAKVGAANVADGHRLCAGFAGGGEGLEVDLVATGEEGGEELRGILEGEGISAGVRGGDVAVTALGEDDIEDIIVVAVALSVLSCGYSSSGGPTCSPRSLAG